MSPVPTDESARCLAATAESLLETPIGEFFRVKCRRLGAIVDATTLRNRGWTLIRQNATPHPRLLRRCLWWSKTFRIPGDDTPWEACLATSGFMVPREDDPKCFRDVDGGTARRLAKGRGIARVFLRKAFFTGVEDDGMTFRTIDDSDVPDEVVQALDDDLSESELFAPDGLLEDLDYHFVAFTDELPEDFADKTALLNQITGFDIENGDDMVVERQLCRWVRGAVDPDWSPDTADDFEALSDGWVLWDLLSRWSDHANDRNVLARLVGWLLERAPRLSRPLTAIGWRGLAALLWNDLRLRKAAVCAMEAALEHDDSEPRDRDRLWRMLQEYWQDENQVVPVGSNPGWFIKTLYRHEDFADRPGYSTLLALALAIHGKSHEFAAKLAMGALKFPDWEPGTCPRFPDVAQAAEWQASMIVGMGYGYDFLCRRALALYPEPLLSAPYSPFDLPQQPIAGLWIGDGLAPLMHDVDAAPFYNSENPPPWRDAMECLDPPPGHTWLSIPEMVSLPNGIGVATRFFCYSGQNDFVNICAIQILRLRRRGPGGEPLHEQYYPVPTPSPLKSVKPRRSAWRTVQLWKAYPHATGLIGEADFTLDGQAFAATLPCFALDRQSYVRGMPVKAFLYAFFLEKPLVGIPVRDDELGEWLKFNRYNCDNTRSYYEFRGMVRHIGTVSVAGGGSVFRVEVEVGGAVGTVPVFVHESRMPKVGQRPLAPGDSMEGELLLFADVDVPGEEVCERWKAAHPGGEKTPPELERIPRRPLIGLMRKDDASDAEWEEALAKWGRPDRTPLDFELEFDDSFLVDVAVEALCQQYHTEDVAYQPFNPRGIDVSARVGEPPELRHYRVVLVRDDDKVTATMPPGIEPLVIRVRDISPGAVLVEYEGALHDN